MTEQPTSAIRSLRLSAIQVALIVGVYVAASTELLSHFSALNAVVISAADAVFLILLAGFGVARWMRSRSRGRFSLPYDSRPSFYYVPVLLIAGTSLFVALAYPPNNWDSMTYHMARVVYWIQNRSVDFYPTGINRQLFSNPLAEYFILHLQLIAGNDRFANLVQWASLVGSAVAVSLIVEEFAETKFAAICAAFAVTLPMGILQSTSTQNDYVVSFWLLTFALFTIRYVRTSNPGYAYSLGLSLGLAILTKAIAYIFAFPFCVWLLWHFLRKGVKREWPLILSAILALVLNLGHYYRNQDLYKDPLGINAELAPQINGSIGVSTTLSNLTRNVALNLGTPWREANRFVESVVRNVHQALGISVDGETFNHTRFGVPFGLHEDIAGNPLHLFVLFAAAAFSLIACKRPIARWYLACALIGFLLFCVILRWQPWGSRLLLPFFLLTTPAVGLMLTQVRARYVPALMVLLLMAYAVPFALFNSTRPLLELTRRNDASYEVGLSRFLHLGRDQLYMMNSPDFYEPYKRAAVLATSNNCRDVGLLIGGNTQEYPLWIYLRQRDKRVRIFHIDVTNVSAKKSKNRDAPCAIVAIDRKESPLGYEGRLEVTPLSPSIRVYTRNF